MGVPAHAGGEFPTAPTAPLSNPYLKTLSLGSNNKHQSCSGQKELKASRVKCAFCAFDEDNFNILICFKDIFYMTK